MKSVYKTIFVCGDTLPKVEKEVNLFNPKQPEVRLKGKCLRSFVHFKTSFHTTDTKLASKVVWGLYIYTNPITGKIMFIKYIGSTRVSCC